ncbi:TetR/AcrR family transcriptional regulator [Janthinobacterium sp. Mn2066]|uniref:TetR/AcrR family transcriptional regulator n=1 Tax=Janthinobacterium sp. Mn2066 TaxID=3395264 RepID=UPI003BD75ED7
MKKRSASADRICTVAVGHFSEHGYDGSSLSDIAELAGMRKASLYSHFDSKDDLFLAVFADALLEEHSFMQRCFDDEAALQQAPQQAMQQAGALYCDRMAQRYGQSPHARFLLRTVYLPPQVLRDHITGAYRALLDQLERHYAASLLHAAPWLAQPRLALYVQAYLGIIDSMQVELIYADGAALQQRHAALWQILSDSLAMAALSHAA